MRTFAFALVPSIAALVFYAGCGSEVCSGANCDAADGSSDAPAFIVPDGSITLPDGAIVLPDGAVVSPDGAVLPTPDGGFRGTPLPDGGLAGCVPGNTQCTNCVDDDGDGKADFIDPECTGSLDNDEASFSTGIPGDNIDCKQDCYFDGNSGSGNDGCEWNPQCDPKYPGSVDGSGKTACAYDEKKASNPNVCPPGQPQSQKCQDFCAPLTPNGCDCFGCCDLYDPAGNLLKTVSLNSGCSLANINDPVKCATCTKSTTCVNDCQKCELCIGKPTLPADCYNGLPDTGVPAIGVPGQVCSGGQQSCNDQTPCPVGKICLTGCCINDLQ